MLTTVCNMNPPRDNSDNGDIVCGVSFIKLVVYSYNNLYVIYI